MNDSQKYKLILWHSFLEDMSRVKHVFDKHFPEYEIDYCDMVEVFNWHIENCEEHDRLYPWMIHVRKQKKKGIRLWPYEKLLKKDEKLKHLIRPDELVLCI